MVVAVRDGYVAELVAVGVVMAVVSWDDLWRGYNFLFGGERDGEQEGTRGVIELNAIPAPGAGWSYAVVRYASSARDVAAFVRRYGGGRWMVCHGLNFRAEALVNSKGYPRSSLEREIAESANLLLDLDFVDRRRVTAAQTAAVESFLDGRVREYVRDLGFRLPARASTGRGQHLLFAYRAIRVAECPDVRCRLETVRDAFSEQHAGDLDRLELRVDRTQELRRMVRVYGTAKPGVGVVSRFYGSGRRVEDERFRSYVLGLRVPERLDVSRGPRVPVGAALPSWVNELLESDERFRALWENRGKPVGTDTSRSGFDYSIARYLLRLGRMDVQELVTVLALRPGGAVQERGRGEEYLRRTIAAALVR